MPIEKIPVVHKFGIISHSHRLEIQERIIAEAKNAKEKAQINTTIKSTRPSYLIGNISEEFVKNFNYEKDPKKRSTLQQQADNILNLIKRKMAVNDRKDYEAVAKSWIDLSLLSQCTGEIQESSLDVLISSLGSGIDFHVTLLPAIMYLAEATLFWLKYKLMREPFLRTSELKLLRAGELVFDRLYCHFMLGDLIGHEDFLQRLKDYNEEFLKDTEDTYSSYPTIVQSLSNISACANLLVHASAEQANEHCLPEAFNSVDALETTSLFHSMNPFFWHALDIFNCVRDTKSSTKTVPPKKTVNKALKSMLVSEKFSNLNSDSSLHIIQALKLLAQMASKNPKILRVFQQELDSKVELAGSSIATESPRNSLNMYPDGMNTPANNGAPGSFVDELHSIELSADDEQNSLRHSLEVNALHPPATNRSDRSILSHRISGSLEQIKENDSPPNMNKSGGVTASDTEPKDLTPRQKQKGKLLQSSGEVKAPSKSLVTEEDIAWDNLALVDKHLWSNTPFNRSAASISKPNNNQDQEILINSRQFNAAWEERPSEARSSRLMTRTHRSNSEDLNDTSESVIKSWPSFSQWPESCAIAYTKLMGLIVICGATADLRKAALLGSNYTKAIFNTRDYEYRKLNASNVGLIDLLYLQENGCSWAWKVRFAALESLGCLYSHLEGNASQDGLRNICWACILDACIRDPDPKVAEAKKTGGALLKVTNNTSKLESLSPRQATLPEITLYGSILTALSDQQARIKQCAKKKQQVPEVKQTNVKTTTRHHVLSESKGPNLLTVPSKARVPLLKDELEVHAHLNEKPLELATRNQIDLHRILEDQWRKDLHDNNPELNLESSLNSTPVGSDRK